ncbi:MAG: hypothetical protein MH204_10435 [Fimbriimonadaceae bacterium]|nr:hypothetical protein [Fimbriimonadaceae bacterium]
MIVTVVRFSGLLAGLGVAVAASSQAQIYFTQDERSAVLDYWNQSGRYSVEASSGGAWAVRQTPEGSAWLWRYSRALRPEKTDPGRDVRSGGTAEQAAWDRWIDLRIERDYALAAQDAARRNSSSSRTAIPADPGPMPAGLRNLVGEAPPMAWAVQPRRHEVVFADGVRLGYTDHVELRPKFAYFRFNEGIRSFGQRVKDMDQKVLENLFRRAGLGPSEMRVMRAVSLLEGGFDSINTYDTGFVSVGMIQFAALENGSGSLGQVLLDLKTASPQAFAREFRSLGVDVTPEGALAVLCPTTGVEFIGSLAAQKIILDPRLAAVFQRAGQVCDEFRVSQLRVAKRMYYPEDDRVAVTIGGARRTVRLGDVFQSEAGMATLMDRKVNTGRLGSVAEAMQAVARQAGINDPGRLEDYEYDLVKLVRYRKDYLQDASLTRPRSAVARTRSTARR